MPNIQELDLTEAGFITVSRAAGPPVKYPLADILRAADIPTGLTYEQVIGITTLANLVVVLIRTLVNRGLLDESFMDDAGMEYDLDGLIESIEAMGGAYHDPVLNEEAQDAYSG